MATGMCDLSNLTVIQPSPSPRIGETVIQSRHVTGAGRRRVHCIIINKSKMLNEMQMKRMASGAAAGLETQEAASSSAKVALKASGLVNKENEKEQTSEEKGVKGEIS